jgi:hypothetical protein
MLSALRLWGKAGALSAIRPALRASKGRGPDFIRLACGGIDACPGCGTAPARSEWYPRVALSGDHVSHCSTGTIEGVSFQPRDVPVGPVLVQLGMGTVVPGLEEALLGMRAGGKRR